MSLCFPWCKTINHNYIKNCFEELFVWPGFPLQLHNSSPVHFLQQFRGPLFGATRAPRHKMKISVRKIKNDELMQERRETKGLGFERNSEISRKFGVVWAPALYNKPAVSEGFRQSHYRTLILYPAASLRMGRAQNPATLSIPHIHRQKSAFIINTSCKACSSKRGLLFTVKGPRNVGKGGGFGRRGVVRRSGFYWKFQEGGLRGEGGVAGGGA